MDQFWEDKSSSKKGRLTRVLEGTYINDVASAHFGWEIKGWPIKDTQMGSKRI